MPGGVKKEIDMNLVTNHPSPSQFPNLSLTRTDIKLVLVLLEKTLSEVSSQLAKEANLLHRVGQIERDLARCKFNTGTINASAVSYEMKRIDELGRQSLESARDWALVKGQLIKLVDRLATYLADRGHTLAA